MVGRHGQQLALARLEGIGKDDLPFNPFVDESNPFLDDDDDDEFDEEEEEELDGDGAKMDDPDDDDDDEVDDDDDYEGAATTTKYKPDGSVKRKKSVAATLRAGYPSGGLFAVIELGGIQSKVTTDDLLVLNRLQPVDQYRVGSVHTLRGDDSILLVGSTHLTLVGLPRVKGAEVDILIEEITQDAKVVVFKKRRRKHSQRKNGYRRDLTLVRVLDIRFPHQYIHHKYIGRDSVDDLAVNDSDVYDVSSGLLSKATAVPTSISARALTSSVAAAAATTATTTSGRKAKNSTDDDDDNDHAPRQHQQVRVAQ
jgi:large subunit ribosomal protein L21